MTALLTIADVAARLLVKPRTVYDILDRLSLSHPTVVFYRKFGRARRFTEDDFLRIVEA